MNSSSIFAKADGKIMPDNTPFHSFAAQKNHFFLAPPKKKRVPFRHPLDELKMSNP
jgi:hypothetical protein